MDNSAGRIVGCIVTGRRKITTSRKTHKMHIIAIFHVHIEDGEKRESKHWNKDCEIIKNMTYCQTMDNIIKLTCHIRNDKKKQKSKTENLNVSPSLLKRLQRFHNKGQRY